MTLVLTEVSNAGIAMIADSMISYVDPATFQMQLKPPTDQKKLFKVCQPVAGVSYWGAIALVQGFGPEWLEKLISDSTAGTLKEFAESLAYALNLECHGKIIDQPMGVHVAGFDQWSDGKRRPTFFHVHNGHLRAKLISGDAKVIAQAGTGSTQPNIIPTTHDACLRRSIVARWKNGIQIDPEVEPRKQFEAHQDFPKTEEALSRNLSNLATGHITKNGDYYRFILQQEYEALQSARGIPPPFQNPDETGYTLEIALARLCYAADEVLKEKQRHGEPQWFGGTYTRLGICASGFSINDERTASGGP